MIGIILTIISIFLFQNKRYSISITLFFLFITNGFQLIPSSVLLSGLPIDKTSDLAIIFSSIVIFLNLSSFTYILKQEKVFKLLFGYFIFICLDFIYSYYILNYDVSGIFKVFRAHVLLLSFAIFFLVPTSSLLKVLHIIFCITIFQSILFLFQLITGQIILLSSTPGSEVGTNTVEGFKEYTRFYNLPTYLNATLFYFLFVYNFKNKLYKVIILLIISVTIIAPLHRSYIISILCVISLYIFLKQQSGVKFIYLFIIGTLTYSLTFIEIINHRLNEAFSDISKTFSAKSINSIDPTENTLNFRVAHFYERFEYLLNKPDGWLFGIGLISDNSKEADRLRFETGLTNEKLNRVTQIDSADLVWSPLMLQTGLLGTILYGVLMFYMMYFFSKEKTNQYGVIGYLCIVEAFFVSMLGTDMIQNSFKIMIILLAVISSKIYRNEKSRQFNHNVHDSNKKYFYA